MQREDDRTAEQRSTHTVIVHGRDRCLSGWGRAEGGVSYAGWACRPEHSDKVERWVRSRGDMKRVSVSSAWFPRGRGHAHIYVVDDNHPAID